MEVITTHTNADFDTLASMIAAKKLYPEATLVFPGSLEKGLRSAIRTLRLPYTIERAKDIDLERVTRLILVDIRQAARIGRFADIIGRKGLDVHIYDHHPAREDDIKGSVEVVRPYGSTTTILTLLLKEKSFKITPEEATILMAGIYEDTGSLSFPSTSVEDYEAASFLLSCGADLKAVTRLLKKELTPQEVAALNKLIESEVTYTIGGISVVVAMLSIEEYKNDIATLAHRLMDMEHMDCLFLLVETADRVHVVIRSAVPEVDAGCVAEGVGGGGHPQAASATLKGVTLIQAREKVLKSLKERIAPRRSASDIMSSPAITISPETTLSDAARLLRRYNINAMPVVRNGRLAGVITRQVVDRALDHGLGKEEAGDYMTTDVDWVEARTPVEEIRTKVGVYGQRLLPVVDKGRVVGVITRTDMLKLLQEELTERPSREMRKKRLVGSLMKERLPEWAYRLLRDIGATAGSLGYSAYAVGGFVRDLILRRENLDIDIVVEGDGIRFANEFAAGRGLRVKSHDRFKTAVIVFPDGFKLDVATARLEYYERPGALPTVELSSLKLDLYRRDFTINTLAVALNPERFGELIDFFGAQKDIKEKTIRVLHNLSFVEDPVRALRAVRFSERFGFRIAKHTLNLIKNSVKLKMLHQASGARIRDELKNILLEERGAAAIARLSELGLLSLIHENLEWNDESAALFERTREVLAWYRLLYTEEKAEDWIVLFLSLTDKLTQEELDALSRRLMITGRRRIEVIRRRRDGVKALGLIGSGRVRKGSELYEVLNPLPVELVLYLMARSVDEGVKKAVSTYVTELRSARTALKGADLKAMGFEEGPVIGEVLNTLLKKRLDGEILSKEDEEEFVRGLATNEGR